ncbi:hypothetical protein ACFE04_008326 [Oxalis oulophora]
MESNGCLLCGRMLLFSSEPIDLCGDCNFLYLEQQQQQQQHDVDVDDDVGTAGAQANSDWFLTHQFSDARRRLSDTETSFYAESDAVSFSVYAEEDEDDNEDEEYDSSDISVHGGGLNNGIIMGLGGIHSPHIHNHNHSHSHSHSNSDTDDIDPMHARWNSDDEDSEWEEVDATEEHGSRPRILTSTVTSNAGDWRQMFDNSPEFEGVIHWRFRQEIGRNSGDYLDARGFEQFLDHLAAESEVWSRGAPPASVSFVKNLPRVIVKQEEEDACAICKDVLSIGSQVNQLPCLHLYHPCCILPWLSTRNSCPLCRYELPTDDDNNNNNNMHESDDDSSVASVETETAREMQVVNLNPNNAQDGGGRGTWFFLAAAPIVSLVGIVLVLCLGNPAPHFCNISIPTHRAGNRNRRWWFFF